MEHSEERSRSFFARGVIDTETSKLFSFRGLLIISLSTAFAINIFFVVKFYFFLHEPENGKSQKEIIVGGCK